MSSSSLFKLLRLTDDAFRGFAAKHPSLRLHLLEALGGPPSLEVFRVCRRFATLTDDPVIRLGLARSYHAACADGLVGPLVDVIKSMHRKAAKQGKHAASTQVDERIWTLMFNGLLALPNSREPFEDCAECIEHAYDMATTLLYGHTPPDPSLIPTVSELATGDPSWDILHPAMAIKLACLHVLDTCIRNALDAMDSAESLPESDPVDRLYSVVMRCMDVPAPLDGPASFLMDAPVLVDLETETDVSHRIRVFMNSVKGSDPDPRLEYLAGILDQGVSLAGLGLVKRARQDKQQAAARKAVQKSTALNGSTTAPLVHPVASAEDHVTDQDIARASLITQVQDLFPDLGDGFIEACLAALNYDTELVIMKILEDDLPDIVCKLDRTLKRAPVLPPRPSATATAPPPKVIPIAPPEPKPVAVPTNEPSDTLWPEGRILSRHKPESLARVLNDKSFVNTHKDDILDASYDDEYDDTYDGQDAVVANSIERHMIDEDVGVAESNANLSESTPAPPQEDPSERLLVETYQSDPGVFSNKERKSVARARLREQLGWSHEQIEGWFTMFNRSSAKNKILEKYEWRGNKPVLDEPTVPDPPLGGTPHGGQTNPRRDHQLKSRNKAGRGNHHRKRGHDRKMNRGMGGPI